MEWPVFFPVRFFFSVYLSVNFDALKNRMRVILCCVAKADLFVLLERVIVGPYIPYRNFEAFYSGLNA